MHDPVDDATTKYYCGYYHFDSELDEHDLKQHHLHSIPFPFSTTSNDGLSPDILRQAKHRKN